ncbi:MAG TPA: hypothetical protein PKX84_02865, partial [Bacteroidia bacterium]|nr:hypothetical protein [Bacteroidia bacterium]
ELILSHSVFSVGGPDVANSLAGEPGSEIKIMIGVTDRYSDRWVKHKFPIANNRQVFFPLADGTWLGVKGSGQFRQEYLPPHFYNEEARVKLNGVSMYIDKTGSNDEERKKIAEEEAEKKKQERKALIDRAIENAKRDTMAKEVFALYQNENQKVVDKVKELQRYVESTMIYSEKYGFNKSNWVPMSIEINKQTKVTQAQVNSFKDLLKKYELTKGKNELYDRISVNLSKTTDFIAACSIWGDYIYTLGANDDGKKELERVDDSLIDLKKHDDALRSFITLYKKRNSL